MQISPGPREAGVQGRLDLARNANSNLKATTRRPGVTGPVRAILLSLALAACRSTPEGEAVARVGDRTLTLEDLERRVPVQLVGRLSASDRKHMVDSWVDEQLLVQEAVQRELHDDPLVAERVAQAGRDLLIAELLERELRSSADVDEAAIQDYYLSHQDDLIREQPEIRVRHILVPARSDINRVRARLDRGELFDQAAREESIDESAERGGDLGYFTEEMVDPSFWAACQKAAVGRPVQARTRLGYHLVEVLDRREAGVVRDLIEVKSDIRQRILSARRQANRDSLLQTIRRRVPVSVDEQKLSLMGP